MYLLARSGMKENIHSGSRGLLAQISKACHIIEAIGWETENTW